MQRLLILILSLTFVAMAIAADVTKSTINIEGMTCNDCVDKVTAELQKVDGVKKVSVDLKKGQATVEHENANSASLNSAIVKAGFRAVDSESDKFELDEKESKTCTDAEKSRCSKPCSAEKKEI